MDGSGDSVHTHRCLSLKKVRRSRVTGKSKATTRRLKLSAAVEGSGAGGAGRAERRLPELGRCEEAACIQAKLQGSPCRDLGLQSRARVGLKRQANLRSPLGAAEGSHRAFK